MSVVLVIAVVWLFLLALAVAILRSAAMAERAAEERLRAARPSSPRPRRTPATRRRTVTTAVTVVALPLAGGAIAAADASAQVCSSKARAAQMSAPSGTLCLINIERRARGLAPLVGNPRLARAARRHAADMVRRNYFSHVSPEGTGFFERLRRAGYPRGCESWSGGETLAWGSGSLGTPQATVASWMNSPGHRAVLLGRSYREAGIGVVRGAPGTGGTGVTYAGEFGRRRC